MSCIYRVEYTYSARDDMLGMKKYILDTFKYRELGDSFIKKMKEAEKSLKVLPTGYNSIGFQYRGYDIHLKPYKSYLFFYVIDEKKAVLTVLRVMQDGMNWEYILKRWLREQNDVQIKSYTVRDLVLTLKNQKLSFGP